jgi:Tfp pilus assembly protein PilF
VSRSDPHRKSLPPSRPKPQASQPAVPKRHLDPIIWIGLVLSILAVYAQVGHFDFVNYDDTWYVTENVHVQAGLTPENIKWALTSVVDANWAPLTILSHMAVCTFFGLQSGMHHWVNVVLHALAAILLFASLRRATRALWPSAFVAFIFALHPLHVESVAWVSERKDVLSTFFWFLALYAYVRYTEQPGPRRYALVIVPFCLGLMAKAMLVTFPFTLLLLDVWPFRRAQFPRTLWEKAPLFAISLVSSIVTYLVQRSGGAVQPSPLGDRVRNALISYVSYIGQTFWPAGLAVFYPYRTALTVWHTACAFAIISGVSTLAIFAWRTRPYLATGWFWYLGTLVPVIGLLQVGGQAHADRYMYIPMVGLSVMLAWGALDVVRKWPRTRFAITAAAVVSCLACLGLASAQAGYWRNSESLYRRAIAVTENNELAQYNLGDYLMSIPDRRSEAVTHFEAALRIRPDYPDAHNHMGGYLVATGHLAEGIAQFEAAVRAYPDYAEAHFNLGVVFSKMPGRELDAIAHYQAGLRVRPDVVRGHKNLAQLLLRLGRTSEAISHFEAAQRLQYDPEVAKLLNGLRAGKR